MSFRTFSAILVTTVVVSFGVPSVAQDKTDLNMDDAATGQPGGVAQFDMAQGLYALSLSNKDALLALTAAKLAAGVQMTELEREGERKPAETVTEAVDVAEVPADAAAMFASARAFAAGDEILMMLIEEVEAEGARGGIGGASRQLSRLPAGAIDVWKIPFYGSSYAEIGVSGDGDAPLSVTVTDENGNRVSCPVRVHDRFYCNFVPRWNGYFTVSVANTGRKPNSYYLLTN